MNEITWKADPITGEYVIFEGAQPVGFFKRNFWANKAKAEWKGKSYTLKFPQRTVREIKVFEEGSEEVIAEGKYNWMSSKADVKLHDGTDFYWKYTNFSQDKWEITHTDGESISYKESWNKGSVISSSEQPSSFQMMLGIALHQHLRNIRYIAVAAVFLIVCV